MNRFGSRFYTEEETEENNELLSDDMEEITIGDLKFDENDESDLKDEEISDNDTDTDDNDSLDVPAYMKDRLSEDDRESFDDEDGETEDMDLDDVDLGSFGSDSSDVQNDYDPKEVERLMKLMASEADALGEYLDAAKETNTDVLRRLYADIGNEERFHMEQLLFAKSELTGEKYQPKDPDVKHEYEELLEMGMDEETAMQTAVDKLHIRGSVETTTPEDVVEMAQSISADITVLEQSLAFFSINLDNLMQNANSSRDEVDKAYVTFMEACYMEDVHMKDSDTRGIKMSKNPFRILLDAFAFIVRTLVQLVSKIKEFFSILRNKRMDISAYIKRYGFSHIFDFGIHLYFDPTVDHGKPRLPKVINQWAVLALDTIELVYKEFNVKWSTDSAIERFRTENRSASLVTRGNITYATGMLNQLHLTKTKVLLPKDKNEQEELVKYLLSYTDSAKSGRHGESDNIINDYSYCIKIWNIIIKYAEALLKQISGSNSSDGPRTENSKAYNRSHDALQAVMKSAQGFTKAITSDINTMIKLNKDVYNEMITKDQARNPRAHEETD